MVKTLMDAVVLLPDYVLAAMRNIIAILPMVHSKYYFTFDDSTPRIDATIDGKTAVQQQHGSAGVSHAHACALGTWLIKKVSGGLSTHVHVCFTT